MAVHELGYERWEGSLTARKIRWLPMVRYHVNLILKRKMVWLILLASLIPALVFSSIIYISSDSAREGTALEQAISAAGAGSNQLRPTSLLINQIIAKRKGQSEQPTRTLAQEYWLITTHGLFFFLLWPQSFVVMLVASAVGAGLVAQDIRSNALEIYLTKPITPLDYVMGKLCVVASFIMFTTFVPAMIVYGVAAASWQGFLGVTWQVIPPLFGVCLIASVVNGLVILGLSSLARSARYATVIWFAMGFISSATSVFLTSFTDEKMWSFVSYRNNFLYIFSKMLDVDLELVKQIAIPSTSILLPVGALGVFVIASWRILRKTIQAVEAN